MYNLSGCVFIRNALQGAFPVFETIAQFLHLCNEMIVLDLGSTDSTIEFLAEIAQHNPKIKLVFRDSFPCTDAGVFATLANDLIAICQNDNVVYWQADEFWHEDLLKLLEQRLDNGQFDLSFWRIQYRDNFQRVKWFPHLVHRIGCKGSFEFNGDGMNTTRTWDAQICSSYGGEYFPKWGDMGQEGIKPYVNQMVTDISLVGGFRDNISDRRRMHAPFWHEPPDIEGIPESEWYTRALNNPDWTKSESPYNLPVLLRYHVGRTKYELRPELLGALKRDETREYISSL